MIKKVLIVEDSQLQAKMYRVIFGKFPGCKLVFATDGLDAIDKLALENDIELIILDINMPKMDGLSFLKKIKQEGYTKIPVIVISTEGQDNDIKLALQEGASAYVKKPWNPVHVLELINKVMAKTRDQQFQ
jgi:two-component system chemotaxis response regulator CheY